MSSPTQESSDEAEVKDRSGPVLTFLSPLEGSILAPGVVTLSADVSDKDSGVASLEVFLNGVSVGSPSFSGSGISSPVSFTHDLDLTPGGNEILVESKDTKGNESFDTLKVEAIPENSEPIPPLDLSPQAPQALKPFITPGGTNPEAKAPKSKLPFLRPANNTPTPPVVPAPSTPSLPPVTPVPPFLTPNPSLPPVVPPIAPPVKPPLIDRTPPVLRIITPTNTQAINVAEEAAVFLTGEVEDASSSITRVSVNVDGINLPDADLVKLGSVYSFSSSFTPDDGPRIITVTAFDGAGNLASASRSVTISSPGNMIPSVDLDFEASAEIEASILSATSDSLTLEGLVSPVEVGEIVIIGVTSATPEGAIRRVTSITTSNGDTVLSTEVASLPEAFTELRLDATIPLSDPSGTSGAQQRRSFAAEAVSMNWGIEVDETLCIDAKAKEVACDGATKIGEVNAKAAASAKLELGVEVAIEIYADEMFEFPKLQKFSTLLVGEQTIESSLDVDAAFGWEAPAKKITLDKIPPFTLPAGPVVIVFKPEIELEGTVGWSVDGALTLNARASATQKIGAVYTASDGWTPVKEMEFEKSTESAAELKGELYVDFKSTLYVQISGVAGPTLNLNVRPALSGTVSDTKSASLSFDTLVEAGVGVKVEVLSKTLVEWSNPDLFSKSFNLFYLGGYNLIDLDGEKFDLTDPSVIGDHRVQFESTQGERVRLYLDGEIAKDATLTLERSDGSPLSVQVINGVVDFNAPDDDTYRLRIVSPSGATGSIQGIVRPDSSVITAGTWTALDVAPGLGQALATFEVPAGHAWSMDLERIELPGWTDGKLSLLDAQGAEVATRMIDETGSFESFIITSSLDARSYSLIFDSNGPLLGSLNVFLSTRPGSVTEPGEDPACTVTAGPACQQPLTLSSYVNFMPAFYNTPEEPYYYLLNVEEGQLLEFPYRGTTSALAGLRMNYEYYSKSLQTTIKVSPNGPLNAQAPNFFLLRVADTDQIKVSFTSLTWSVTPSSTKTPFEFFARQVNTVDKSVISGQPFELEGLPANPTDGVLAEKPILTASFEANEGDQIVITMPTMESIFPYPDDELNPYTSLASYGPTYGFTKRQVLAYGFSTSLTLVRPEPTDIYLENSTQISPSGDLLEKTFTATGSGTHKIQLARIGPFFNHQMKYPMTVAVIPASEIP